MSDNRYDPIEYVAMYLTYSAILNLGHQKQYDGQIQK